MKGMRWRAAILQCKKCGWYSGWKARRNRGVKTIDTLCSVCNSRLRHTPSPDEGQAGWGSYRPGRGAHNRGSSVSRAWRARPSTVKKEARDMNKARQRAQAERDGFDLSAVEMKGGGSDESE
jgi:hypothetical protein